MFRHETHSHARGQDRPMRADRFWVRSARERLAANTTFPEPLGSLVLGRIGRRGMSFKPDAPVDLEAGVKELEASLGRAHMEKSSQGGVGKSSGIPVKRQP